MTDNTVAQLHRALVDALRKSRPNSLHRPVTVAEIYQDLVPYRTARGAVGFAMNADYEHTLLRLLAGEGDLARIEPREVRDKLRMELESPNPDVGLFRNYAACDVWVSIDDARNGDEPEDEQDDGSWEDEFVGPDATPNVSARDILAFDEPDEEDEEDEEFEPEIEFVEDDVVEESVVAAATDIEDIDEFVEEPADEVVEAPRFELHEEEPAMEAAAQDEPAEEPFLEKTPAPEVSHMEEPEERSCAFCGSELPTDRMVNFCPYCGSDQSQQPCPTCGEMLDPLWRFCVACGTRVRPLGDHVN